MKWVRVVYDIGVDDACPDDHLASIVKDTESNLRWGIVHDTAVYPQNLERVQVIGYGARPLPGPPATQA